MQLRKEAWKKFRNSTGFEPVTSRLPVRCSTNWAMKPLTLGAGQLWVHMFPWKKWVLMIYEINHMWTAEMKWKWRNDGRSDRNLCNRTGNREVTGSNPVEVLNFFQVSLRNCINCVHCDDHFFIFISFPQFIYDLFYISLTLSTLLGQQCWESLRPFRQWSAYGCNNSQRWWHPQCIVRRIQPLRLCKQWEMRMRCPDNVGRAV